MIQDTKAGLKREWKYHMISNPDEEKTFNAVSWKDFVWAVTEIVGSDADSDKIYEALNVVSECGEVEIYGMHITTDILCPKLESKLDLKYGRYTTLHSDETTCPNCGQILHIGGRTKERTFITSLRDVNHIRIIERNAISCSSCNETFLGCRFFEEKSSLSAEYPEMII